MVFSFIIKQAWKHGDDHEAKKALFITRQPLYQEMINITVITSLVYLSNTTVSFHSAWQEKLAPSRLNFLPHRLISRWYSQLL